MAGKKYGLILPDKGKQGPTFQASRNVFGDDSDSEGEPKKKLALLRPSDNIHRQAKITQEKAVTEDPTVYQYDEIYDEMVGSKEKEKKKNKEDKKPRYIENLMKTASKRKIENERRVERQIQKEREKEGEEFKDKEVFVTSAYKKKLEELKEEEEREKREEYLESIGDVTKQSDLGGFYRHLYEQKLGSDKPADSVKETNDAAKEEPTTITKPDTFQHPKAEPIKKRNYRKRKSKDNASARSDGELEDSDEEINRMNLDNIKLSKKNKKTDENIDADSDFSIDESSEDEGEKKTESSKIKEETDVPKKPSTPEPAKDKTKTETKTIKPEPKPVEVVEVKPKIDIWKKRTVGEVFDQALRRYYERKAARGS